MEIIRLENMTEHAADLIWKSGHKDLFWPAHARQLSEFQAYVKDFTAAQVLGWGCIRQVQCTFLHRHPDGGAVFDGSDRHPKEDPVGFVTFRELEPAWTNTKARIFECGTFLNKENRGQGLNLPVKVASVTLAFCHLGADYVIYAVPDSNRAAVRSLQRILKASPKNDPLRTQLNRWLRYREWKESQSFQLFVIDLESAKACNLLNPNCNDGHLVGEQ